MAGQQFAEILVVTMGSVAREKKIGRQSDQASDVFEPPLEDAEILALRRVRNGQVSGSTTIEEFVDEQGITPDDLSTRREPAA